MRTLFQKPKQALWKRRGSKTLVLMGTALCLHWNPGNAQAMEDFDADGIDDRLEVMLGLDPATTDSDNGGI